MHNLSEILNEDVIHEDFVNYFNSSFPHYRDWSLEKGYTNKNENKDFYPFNIGRVVEEYLFDLTKEMKKYSCGPFSIIIHLPCEIPTMFHKTIPVEYGNEMSIFMAAKSQRMDDAMRDFSPDVRKCFFQGERKLKFYKYYSKAHCELECLANDTLKDCNCVPFYLPRDKLTRVCNQSSITCFKKKEYEDRVPCGCYSTCNDITYNVETYSGEIDTVTSKMLSFNFKIANNPYMYNNLHKAGVKTLSILTTKAQIYLKSKYKAFLSFYQI